MSVIYHISYNLTVHIIVGATDTDTYFIISILYVSLCERQILNFSCFCWHINIPDQSICRRHFMLVYNDFKGILMPVKDVRSLIINPEYSRYFIIH